MARPLDNPSRHRDREALGLAIKRLRKRADLTQDEAAAAMTVQPNSWRRYEWGERGLDLEKLAAIAQAIGTSREEIIAEAARIQGGPLGVPGSAEDLRRASARGEPGAGEDQVLAVRDRLQAGAWLAADDLDQSQPRTYPAARDPRYAHAAQWLAEIVGDSMDALRIYEGDYAHLVDAVAIGYAPRTGDVVEVERTRFGGQMRELTLKQVEVQPDGRVLLWPRSNNPRWREPLDLAHGLGDGESYEVRIRALLLNTIRRF